MQNLFRTTYEQINNIFHGYIKNIKYCIQKQPVLVLFNTFRYLWIARRILNSWLDWCVLNSCANKDRARTEGCGRRKHLITMSQI